MIRGSAMDGLMTIDEMRQHEWVVSWSGGKDSTATIILMHENNVPIKKIVYVRMMWDDEIPATLPVMTDFVDHAAEVFRGWGYEVQIVKSYRTAKSLTEATCKRSKHPERIGKRYGIGAFSRGRCKFTSVKTSTVKKLQEPGAFAMIGYAVDEERRWKKTLGGGNQSIMVALNIIEEGTFSICKQYDLLSPLYELGIRRDGCFFCPNAARLERYYLHKNYPELAKLIYQIIEDSPAQTLNYPNAWVSDYCETGGIVGNHKPWHQQTKLLI